jgi:uncharacterized protein (TIGR03000 family)
MVMHQRFCAAVAVAALAGVLLLTLPGQAQAQARSLGGFPGYYPGGYGLPYYGGYAQANYGVFPSTYYGGYTPYAAYTGYTPYAGAYGPSWGYGYQPYSFYNAFGPTNNPNMFYEPWGLPAFGVNPGYYSAGYGTPVFNGLPPYYSAAAQRFYGANYAVNPGTESRQSFYPPADGKSAGKPANIATVQVTVPSDAEVWFEGTKTTQLGTVRQFRSPPLDPDSTYTYTVRARWTQNGEVKDETRDLRVQANKRAYLDFTIPAK